MNKLLALGFIIFFILVIAAGAIWLTIRPAPEIPEPERGVIRRFPFGIFRPEPETTPGIEIPVITAEKRALTLLSSQAISGFSILEKGARFIEKGTGHVFDIGPQGEERIRISNTTIPKIFEVDWSPNASKAILKYFSTPGGPTSDGEENLRIVSAVFEATSTKATILPATILSAVYAPERERILYLLPTEGGVLTIAADPDNTNQREVFFSPFQEFNIDWPSKDTISYLSRPSGIAPGFLFLYDLAKGSFDKILGDILGLEVRWLEGNDKIIYSAYNSTLRTPQLFIYDLAKKNRQALEINTLAHKCVDAKTQKSTLYCGIDANPPQALYPDEWLQGIISTTDAVWKIDLESGEKNLLDTEGRFFDISHIDISLDDRFLYFVDKKNNSFWSLKLTNN